MATLSAKARVLTSKIETTYGVDSVPTASDAMLVSNLDVSPAEAETVERDLLRPYFGQAERLQTQIYAKMAFNVELGAHSAGVVGGIPKIDSLLQSCGFVGSELKTPLTSLTRTGSTATATLAGHTLKIGDKFQITGATESDYNILGTVTAVTSTTFSYAVSGTPTTPATGVPSLTTGYKYTPISTNIKSTTHYYNVGEVLHKITGSRGTFGIDIAVKQIPNFKFDFTGLNNDAVDLAPSGADYSKFKTPFVANTQNTTGFSILGYSGALESLSLAMNNSVQYTALIGEESVSVLDRKVSGNISFKATTVAEKDFWKAVKDQVSGSLTITHGKQNGNIVQINVPKVLLDSPKYKELDNVMMFTCGVSCMPVNGNDEIEIIFK